MNDEQIIKELTSTSYVEILLRGRTVQVSSRIEHYLIAIMVMSKATKPDTPSNQVKFVKTTFDDKINKAQKYLKEFDVELYDIHKQSFIDLFNKKEFRNRLAHCNIKWNPKDRSYFVLFDKVIGEDGQHDGLIVKYTIQEAFEEIESLVKSQSELFEIYNKIIDKIGETYPALAEYFRQGEPL